MVLKKEKKHTLEYVDLAWRTEFRVESFRKIEPTNTTSLVTIGRQTENVATVGGRSRVNESRGTKSALRDRPVITSFTAITISYKYTYRMLAFMHIVHIHITHMT